MLILLNRNIVSYYNLVSHFNMRKFLNCKPVSQILLKGASKDKTYFELIPLEFPDLDLSLLVKLLFDFDLLTL